MSIVRPIAVLALFALTLPFSSPIKVQAASLSEVTLYNPDGTALTTFIPFKDVGGNAGSITAADLGTDGVSEILVGAGKGTRPLVRAFRQDGSLIFGFEAYAKGFTGGVTVAACDLNNDGKTEIITGTGYSGGPHVRIFDNTGLFTGMQFFAYDENFRGGVNVACGDVDGDEEKEIVTGVGLTGGSSVKIFSANGNIETERTLALEDEKGGITVTVSNIDEDPEEEILVAPMNFGDFDLTVIDRGFGGYTEFTKDTKQPSATYGSSVTVANKKIYYANGAYLTPALTALDGETQIQLKDYGNGFSTLLTSVKEDDTVIAVSSPTTLSPEASGQYIRVDLSEQRLTAYDNGVEVKTFLISSGKRGFSTPVGKDTILAKIPVMTYAWSYGPNNPNNYNLPGVKWNLRFRKHFYIHSAYWHNNFGTPMSHGCINTSIKDGEWIYNWANVGATVEIVP